MRELTIRGVLGKFPQGFAPWTVNALGIGKVFMHDTFKCVEELFFNVRPALPV